MSARIMVRNGPGRSRDRSRTRTPSSACASDMTTPKMKTAARGPHRRFAETDRRSGPAGEIEELLQLHREHRIARHAQLALEVQLHARVRVRQHLLEVVVRDLDRALRLAGVALDDGRRVRGQIGGPLTAALAADLERVDRVD